MRADVFVLRLIERIGLRRHRLFVATPEAAERLQSLSRLSELAAEWTQREPRGSVRDFVRHLTAVADAGELEPDDAPSPSPGTVVLAEPEQVKGLEFDHVYLLGLHREAIAGRDSDLGWIPAALVAEQPARRARGVGARAPARPARLPVDDPRPAGAGRLVAGGRRSGGRWARPPSTRRPARRWAPTRRSTRRSCSGPPRDSTRPTGCCATRSSRRPGAPDRRSRRCASTPPRT